MKYREVLGLSKKHATFFSANQRKNRLYDTDTENSIQNLMVGDQNITKDASGFERQILHDNKKNSHYNISYREALNLCKKRY